MRSCSSRIVETANASSTAGASVHSDSSARVSSGARRPLASDDVERAVLRHRHQPGAGIVRNAAHLPHFQRAAEGVLHDVFCQREVVHTKDARERRHKATGLAAKEVLAQFHLRVTCPSS
jgi:hypothetical protein